MQSEPPRLSGPQPLIPAAPAAGAFSRWRAGARRLAVGLALALAACDLGTAWAAKAAPAAPQPEVKSYLLPYGLVGLCIALGVMAICRPNSRSDKPRVRARDEAE